jgi:hypothetical protein
MRFTPHYLPANRPHAFLSASKYHWVKYTDEKIAQVFMTQLAAQKGDQLHQLAHDLIKHGIKLPDNGTTMSRYVNDCIGFMMTPEQVLFVSENCYGTADAISFRGNKLRIFDLKTGVTQTSFVQLLVYAAFFCIEYRMKPFEIETELRIYQNDECRVMEGDPDEITHIMDRIKTADVIITSMRNEAL